MHNSFTWDFHPKNLNEPLPQDFDPKELKQTITSHIKYKPTTAPANEKETCYECNDIIYRNMKIISFLQRWPLTVSNTLFLKK